jgi:protein tyrosine/serine phosphatase
MKLIRALSPTLIVTLTLVFAVSSVSLAKSKEDKFPNIKIDNFGQLDEQFYRGARPKPRDLQSLAAMGIKTVIDLTDNSMEREKPAVEAAGMRYINIPIVDKTNPSPEQIATFLKVTNDPTTGKFFVHCAGGRHRTGVMGAVYRFNHDNWNFDQVYAEMKQFDFYTSNGHGKQLDFVRDYWQQVQATQSKSAVGSTSAGR